MIRTLKGTIEQMGDNWLVIDVNDVGYLVGCPILSSQLTLGQTATLHTHLAVRETALTLYGFVDQIELDMFELLLGIPKVGPKSALQILCLATPALLIEATQKKDAVYLHKLSKVGKKTCENIVQYLQNKLDKLPEATVNVAKDNLSQIQTDAIDTLVSLGYETITARDTILKLSDESSTINSLVTQALKHID